MELVRVKGKSRKRIGRGISSGQGKTAGRGTKGQKSRSGYNLPNRHAGGESPLSLRLAKIPGFKSHKLKAVVIDFDDISENYKNNETVSIKTLAEKGILKNTNRIKLLNNGELTVSVKVSEEIKVSASAAKIIASFSVKEEKTPAISPKTDVEAPTKSAVKKNTEEVAKKPRKSTTKKSE